MSKWCEYCIDRSGFFSSSYYCVITGKEVQISSNYINDYCSKDYNVSYCPFYQQYGPKSSGCFITTIICDILNNEDNNEIMNTLRNFRDNVLQENEEYYDILKLYDSIGPIISKLLCNDENREELSKVVLENILKPICIMIKEHKYDDAAEAYRVMTLKFISYYKLKKKYNKIVDDNYNIKNFNPKEAGHGKILIYKTNNNENID